MKAGSSTGNNMITQNRPHSFHIPVMGTGYTVDTPIKVAHYGISSVISIIDHRLTEQMREHYSKEFSLPYTVIPEDEFDARAKRITAYLDLVQDIVDLKFEALKNSPFEEGSEITKYFEMLSDTTLLKQDYLSMLEMDGDKKAEMQNDLRERIVPGSIDVNIMTKIDGPNSINNEELETGFEFNDAHAALRGFANSKLSSSVVFSAGMNPRLYSYIAEFDDFYPDAEGNFKKKVILKVSDYRSSLIQGKFLAKKGIWVSEFRIESGLNCGGHAFATDGYLMGPILKEFNSNRDTLSESMFELLADGLESAGRTIPENVPPIYLTVQGGVGTNNEHSYLLNYEHVDSVGWGSPFLLVPEAVTIDDHSLNVLSNAQEDDYYLSHVSPLGVRFNTVKDNSGEVEKMARVEAGKPGAPCVKKHLRFNTEFTEEPICTASIKYQKKKIDELISMNLPEIEFKAAFDKVISKMCLCVGLGNGALLQKGQDLLKGTQGVAICPGPNTAYFSKVTTLKEMVDHIYGRINMITSKKRPHMFLKELNLYVDYLKEKVDEYQNESNKKQEIYIKKFKKNLMDGIAYYEDLFETMKSHFDEFSENLLDELEALKKELASVELTPAFAMN